MRYIFSLLLFFNISAGAQALRDINYKYCYNPNEPFHFDLKIVRSSNEWVAFYNLHIRDTATTHLDELNIQWELRNGLSEKEGKLIRTDSVQKGTAEKYSVSGKLPVNISPAVQVLVAKVINTTLKRAWIFYELLDPNDPVDGYLTVKGETVFPPYVKKNTFISIQSNTPTKVISYYNDNFPAATPAFSESLGKVSKGMRVDSTFTIAATQEISFPDKGLYLVQNDTSAAQGFAFRVEDDYPRLARVESLADPLIYICTKQEFERIKLAKGDKKAFDRVILNVTGNAERAKNFMRSYFRRVELANQYFTSYKEGWKTDRGMIYTIFGLPDEVFKLANREIWNYKNNSFKIDFEFIKSGTLFDPDNYVLIRQKKFQQTWYEVIDLWRNARF